MDFKGSSRTENIVGFEAFPIGPIDDIESPPAGVSDDEVSGVGVAEEAVADDGECQYYDCAACLLRLNHDVEFCSNRRERERERGGSGGSSMAIYRAVVPCLIGWHLWELFPAKFIRKLFLTYNK